MSKRLIASFLSMLIMLSFSSFVVETVDAADNYTITLTDNFDQYATMPGYTERSASNSTYFPSASHNESTNVFLSESTSTSLVRPWLPENHTDIGLNSPALYVKQSSASIITLQTIALPFRSALKKNSDAVLECSFDIMFLDQMTDTSRTATFGGHTPEKESGTTNILFVVNNDGTNSGFRRNSSGGTFAYSYNLNSWYKMTIRQTGTNREAYMTDTNGDVVLHSEERNVLPANDDICNFKFDIYPSSVSTTFAYLLDNVSLRMYQEHNEAPRFVDATINDDDMNVLTATTSIDATFTQEIANLEDSNVTITAAGGEPMTCTMAKVKTDKTGLANCYKVSFPLASLAENTEYTVDFSDLKNASGLSVAEKDSITFDTGYHAPKLKTASPQNGEDSASIDLKEISFKFDQDLTEYPKTVKLVSDSDVISASVTKIDNRNYTISFDDRFEPATKYEINLAGFASTHGACQTSKYIITSEYDEIVKYVDGFDSTQAITSTTSSASYSSSVLTAGGATAGTDVNAKSVYSLETVSDGDYALKIKTGANTGKYYTRTLRTKNAYSITDDEKLIATWRFNLKDMADWDGISTAGTMIPMGVDTKTLSSSPESMIAYICTNDKGWPQIYYEGDGEITARPIKEDNWYNVVFTLDNNTQEINIIDANPDSATYASVIYSKTKRLDTPVLTAENPYYIHIGGSTVSANDEGLYYNTNQEFLINDFTLWRIEPGSPYMSLQLDRENSEKTMNPNGTISLAFNQPIMAYADGIEIYNENDDEISHVKSMAQIRWEDFCKQELSFTNLESLSNYIVDYQELVSVSGAGVYGPSKPTAIYEFTTTDVLEPVPVFVGDIECTGLSTGDKISFELYAPEEISGTLIMAMYKRFPAKLMQIKTCPLEISATGTEKYEFVLEEDCPDASYIKAFVWDGLEKFVPLTEAYKELSPVDDLDVLMIGSSISEDMQRYLNDVADAGGLNLNLTTKTIGNATLSDHAENLKAELDGASGVAYNTYTNGQLSTKSGSDKLLADLTANSYDVIALQQFGTYSDADFDPSLEYLITEIRKLQPEAEIYLSQPWSPYFATKNERSEQFKNTIENSIDNWAEFAGKTVEFATVNKEAITVIPVGAAFFAADQKYSWAGSEPASNDTQIGDGANTNSIVQPDMEGASGLYRDYNHASWYGAYLADAVWFEMLTGTIAPYSDSLGNAIVPAPDGVDADEHLERLEKLSAIAHETIIRRNDR